MPAGRGTSCRSTRPPGRRTSRSASSSDEFRAPAESQPAMALVRLRGQLKAIAGAAEIPLDAPSVGGLLRALGRDKTARSGWILDERGTIRRHINVFVNGEAGKEQTPVAAHDRVDVLPAISGGGA